MQLCKTQKIIIFVLIVKIKNRYNEILTIHNSNVLFKLNNMFKQIGEQNL